MIILAGVLSVVLLVERLWKHIVIVRFFRRGAPPAANVQLVSILQPILSGDPALMACLEHNLRAKSSYRREFIWLVDTDDHEGQRICRELIARYQHMVRLMLLPPPGERQNPKMFKLIAGAKHARGDVLCVLDDDTMLPDNGLEQCLPFLDQPHVGLAFGLPFYTSFDSIWSRLVAFFVNSHSLPTYVPYTALANPVTINGMFYALRRTTFDAIGGFDGIEQTLADDFAIAQRVRSHGLTLVQTPICHGIHTTVRGPHHYLSLMQRWFIFPRESLLRHLHGRDRALLYTLVLLPSFFPWLALALPLVWPSVWALGLALLYFVASYGMFAFYNMRYFGQVSPWRDSWLVPLIQVTLPIQLLVALCAPQRITWRGHQMQVERGGGFRFVRRKSEKRLTADD